MNTTRTVRTDPSAEAAFIPTSSFADLAFLLLVYFMITTTFAATRGLDFTLPEEDDTAREIDPVESVLVEVLPDGHLRVDGEPMEVAGLLPYLAPKLARHPDKPVIVQPVPESAYGYTVAVLDELRQGKKRLGLEDEIQISLPTRRDMERFWP
jgi:biopolymer transport protein ExbD